MIHKIAVFSDVHGNVSALDAVLRDAKQNGATDYWFLGDLFLPGPGAEQLYETMESIHPAVWADGASLSSSADSGSSSTTRSAWASSRCGSLTV